MNGIVANFVWIRIGMITMEQIGLAMEIRYLVPIAVFWSLAILQQ